MSLYTPPVYSALDLNVDAYVVEAINPSGRANAAVFDNVVLG